MNPCILGKKPMCRNMIQWSLVASSGLCWANDPFSWPLWTPESSAEVIKSIFQFVAATSPVSQFGHFQKAFWDPWKPMKWVNGSAPPRSELLTSKLAKDWSLAGNIANVNNNIIQAYKTSRCSWSEPYWHCLYTLQFRHFLCSLYKGQESGGTDCLRLRSNMQNPSENEHFSWNNWKIYFMLQNLCYIIHETFFISSS